MLIHELMARHAAENPMKTAVSDFRGDMSYGELEARSASAARTVSAFGVRAGSAAAVYAGKRKQRVSQSSLI